MTGIVLARVVPVPLGGRQMDAARRDDGGRRHRGHGDREVVERHDRIWSHFTLPTLSTKMKFSQLLERTCCPKFE